MRRGDSTIGTGATAPITATTATTVSTHVIPLLLLRLLLDRITIVPAPVNTITRNGMFHLVLTDADLLPHVSLRSEVIRKLIRTDATPDHAWALLRHII